MNNEPKRIPPEGTGVLARRGPCRIARCGCGTFRLTIGPATLAISEHTLRVLGWCVDDALRVRDAASEGLDAAPQFQLLSLLQLPEARS